jgi:hypothetical protein
MTLVMTPFIEYYLVQCQPNANHKLSIKFTNLSKRNQSTGCYSYHEILILSVIPNISSVTTFFAPILYILFKIHQIAYTFISVAFCFGNMLIHF